MPSRTGRRALPALAVAVYLAAGCQAGGEVAPPAPAASEMASPAQAGSALDALGTVDVRGRAARTGYDRDEFGAGWVDTDRNGCDTRNDVLARDLTGEEVEPGTRDCVVVSGTLADPYSGRTIAFRRGQESSDDVQIDHVVALSDAWQKGARQWDAERRRQFANDPLNLLAVDGPLNMQKGDGDAATWLPPDRAYRCAYVARQVAVKVAYGLWMTAAERDAVAAVLAGCPDEPLPGSTAPPAPGTPPADTPADPPGPYPDCAVARAADAAPIRVGEPGWNPALDGDGDGVGCES